MTIVSGTLVIYCESRYQSVFFQNIYYKLLGFNLEIIAFANSFI